MIKLIYNGTDKDLKELGFNQFFINDNFYIGKFGIDKNTKEFIYDSGKYSFNSETADFLLAFKKLIDKDLIKEVKYRLNKYEIYEEEK